MTEWNLTADPIIALGVRIGLIILFAMSAFRKVTDMEKFRHTLAGYRLLPEASLDSAAQVILATETMLAIWLLVLADSVIPFAIGFAVLCVYTGAIAINLARGNVDIDCGCLGSSAQARLSPILLVRNLLLLVAVGASLLPSTPRVLTSLDVVAAFGICLVSALLYAGFDKVLANSPAAAESRQTSESNP